MENVISCPICGTEIDRSKHQIAKRLGSLGYLHADVWLECKKCGYKPVFGTEIEKAKPIYWYPPSVSDEKKKLIVEALARLIIPPFSTCICKAEMELHKVWVNTYKASDSAPAPKDLRKLNLRDPVNQQRLFFAGRPPRSGFLKANRIDPVHIKLIESGILAQIKCQDPNCKYVRYLTL